jgi:pSer/pThr/pTyr-binding forkhead associated (FHA) protein
MARLTLQLEDRVLRKYTVGPMATIGRLPDNTIMIDSPAVSSHHACVFRDGNEFAVEDLQSTNGTFVNGTRVSRKILTDGDVVQIGQHQLVLDQLVEEEPERPAEAELSIPNEGATVFIDKRKLMARLVQSETEAKKYDALLARLRDVEAHSTSRIATPQPSVQVKVGLLRVVAGRADQEEYTLEAQTSLVGKGKSSVVRLKGWFKPQVAVAITRNRQGYVATWLGGDVMINSRPVSGRHELKDGDVLDVCGLLMEFRLNGRAAGEIKKASIHGWSR